MAETITIPSPSVFLRASPTPPTPSPKSQPKHERKRSTTTTKKRTSTVGSSTVEAGAVTKPKQSKSRNGCVTCKAKRLKCDETKPGCEQCKKRSVECGGYKKDYKWRPFEETNPKISVSRPKKVTTSNSQFRIENPTVSRPSQARGKHTEDEDDIERRDSKSRSSTVDFQDAALPAFSQQTFTPPAENSNIDPMLMSLESIRQTVESTLHDIQSAANTGEEDTQDQSHAEDIEGLPSTTALDTVALPILDIDSALTDQSPLTQLDYGPFGSPQPGLFDFLMPLDVGIEDDPDTGEDGIEEVSRQPFPTSNEDMLALTDRSFDSSSSGSSSDTRFSRQLSILTNQPRLAQDGPEMLTMRFDRFTCGILSVKDGPNENPWRTLIWPMATTSPALFNAVAAMSAYHSSRDIPRMRIAGHEHSNASIQNLVEGMQEGTVKLDTAIATTLALAFAESWNQHTTSGNAHIKGARAMINEALNRHKLEPLRGIRLARLKFLCNAWVYMDVIARLTSTDEDESDDYDRIFSLYSTSESHSGFGIDFGMPIDARLDPLMGCAGTLFPLIGRVANLVRRVRRSPSNSAPIISQAMELKLLIETWDPPEFIEPPEDPTSNVQHSIQTAEAYRWATLLYLHQAVPEIPSPPASEMAKKVMVYLATVPLVSRFVIVHIFPLMAAGCEAFTYEERDWVRERWTSMGRRLRIGPIDKCMEVTEEVWQRRDEHESRPTNTRKLVATADLHHMPMQFRRGSSFSNDSPFQDQFETGEKRPTSQRRRTMGGASDASMGPLGSEYTVRGRLHWLGVMQDWSWEVLLG